MFDSRRGPKIPLNLCDSSLFSAQSASSASVCLSPSQEILSACWAYDLRDRPTFTQLADMLEKLPKLNRRLSHPGHFWKSAEYVS